LLTLDNEEAKIVIGQNVPFVTGQFTNTGASSGSVNPFQTIERKDVGLTLKVKPQITPDGKITMTLDINKDTPNTKLSTGAGVAIDTKHVKTEVLVENGGTVVIGGIYTQNVSENTQRIPFFGDLPYIGWLFKNREWIDDKTELLIFITPKIVVESLSLR